MKSVLITATSNLSLRLVAIAIMGASCSMSAQANKPILAATPPMGWNSWNFFGDRVSQADVLAAADALVSSGLRDAGYVYVNVDDGWQGTRGDDGVLHPNDRFPDMAGLASQIHLRGLRFGLYSSPGPTSCTGHPGSQGHEAEDAKTFASWGVDFLKYDVCSLRKPLSSKMQGDPDGLEQSLQDAFAVMAKALKATGRPIVLSISAHGMASGWRWAPKVGAQMWRTGDDVKPNYDSIADIGFQQAGLSRFARAGGWNDPDMLEIGNGKLTADEQKTQMSLWAILAAPLIAGNNLSNLKPETAAILKNPLAISIDQDPEAKQGERLSAVGPYEVWSRSLKDGAQCVGLFNRNAAAAWIELPPIANLTPHSIVTDVWKGVRLVSASPGQRLLVPPHGVVLLLIEPNRRSTRATKIAK